MNLILIVKSKNYRKKYKSECFKADDAQENRFYSFEVLKGSKSPNDSFDQLMHIAHIAHFSK